jgi:hypothetical protein
MKKILLTQGKYALVDDEDFEILSKFKWYAAKRGYGFYAQRRLKNISVQMHRFLLNPEKGKDVDHINGDTLDNRRANLRVCSRSQNEWNRKKQKNNTSGFKGVTYNKESKKYFSRIRVYKDLIYLGSFENKVEAAKKYNEAAIKYHGEFALLNEIKA